MERLLRAIEIIGVCASKLIINLYVSDTSFVVDAGSTFEKKIFVSDTTFAVSDKVVFQGKIEFTPLQAIFLRWSLLLVRKKIT